MYLVFYRMKNCAEIWFLLFGTSLVVNCLGSFIPKNKDVVFDYKALVKGGTTVQDQPHDSAFFLFATLRVQSPQDNIIFAQLQNVSFKVYNGKSYYGFENDLNKLPLPKEAIDLTRPFKIMYNTTGQVEAIVTDKTEKVFARNMHKAIAAMLQVKEDSVNFASNVPHGFVTDENSIYGKSHTVYDVLPNNKTIRIRKMHDMKTLKHMYHTMATSVDPSGCDAHYEDPISHDSHQVYIFTKEGEEYIPYQVEASGALYFYPFLGKTNTHYIHSTVSLNLLSVNPLGPLPKINNEYTENQLSYSYLNPNHKNEVPDVFSMNHYLDHKSVTKMLEESMQELIEYWHSNNLDIQNVDSRKSQLVLHMVKILMPLKLADLAKVYTEFSMKGGEPIIILHQLLPLIGTHASITLIAKIVRDRKVENSVAIHMLKTMSNYLQFPNEELLIDTEHILTWGNEIDLNVRKTALLNFAVLIQKTYKYQKSLFVNHKDRFLVHQNNDVDILELERQFLDTHSIYNKFVDSFGAKLTSAEDIPTQILYLLVLLNTGIPNSLSYILPYASKRDGVNHDVREVALYALSSVVLGNHDKVAEVYWPIFSDWTEDTELRIVAYYLLMRSRPPISRLLNIFQQLQNEPNPEVYNFHYSFLQAMMRTTDPCSKTFQINIKQLLQLTRKPSFYGVSHYYQTDFFNKEYGIGGILSGIYISTDRTRMFSLDVYTQVANLKMKDYSLMVKIGGLSGELNSIVELNLKDSKNILNYQKLFNAIRNVPKIKNVQIQILKIKKYNIIEAYFFNEHNMNELYDLFEVFMKDSVSVNKKSLEMYYGMMTQMLMPTEIGMPAYVELSTPTVIRKQINTMKTTTNDDISFIMENMYHVSKNIRWGLRLYNPIIKLQQGVAKKQSFDVVVPIMGNLRYDFQLLDIKLSMKMPLERERNIIGLRSYMTSYVFADTYIDKGYLQQSCQTCTNWYQITNGKFYQQTETVFENKGTSLGFASSATVFKRESYTQPFSIVKDNLGLASGVLTQYILNNLRGLYLGAVLPSPDTQGYLLVVYPTNEYRFTQTDLSLHFVSKLHQKPNYFWPAIEFLPSLTYILKDNDKPVKTWVFNLKYQLSAEHTLQNTVVEVTEITPNQKDFKICFDSKTNWTDEKTNTIFHIGIGKVSDTVCSSETTLDATVSGIMANEIKSPYHQYQVCDMKAHHLPVDSNSLSCASAHASIRKYNYDVKVQGKASYYKYLISNLASAIFDIYKPYHRYFPTYNSTIFSDNDFKIEEEYLTNDDVNFKFVTTDYTHELIGLPASDLSFITFHPDYAHYSKLYMFLFDAGIIHNCVVKVNNLQHNINKDGIVEEFEVTTDWKYVVGDSQNKANNAVYVKRLNSSSKLMALKLIHNENTVEIYSTDSHNKLFQILVDGKEISDALDYYSKDWFAYVIRPNLHSVVISNFKFSLHIVFTGKQIIIETPVEDGIQYFGPCVYKR